MDKQLSDWARENNKSYMSAWREFGKGAIPNAYKASDGRIRIKDSAMEPPRKPLQIELTEPRMIPLTDNVSLAGDMMRYNQTMVQDPLGKFANISTSYTPFIRGTGGINPSWINIRDIIILAQKAYYGFSPVRLVLDTMVEFSASPIYFTGNNKVAINFFDKLLKTINFLDFEEQFFLEYYRSCNCFIWRQEAAWTDEDIQNLSKVTGSKINLAAKKFTLPARYIILNPAEIQVTGTSCFVDATYMKSFTDYELSRLRNPRTPEDELLVKTLPPDVRQSLKSRRQIILLPLDQSKLFGVFQKKMTYEPFAVPTLFPILSDLEFKSELKRLDMQVARTIQNSILHVKVGMEAKDGSIITNQKIVDALQKIFQNPTVSRTLVTDFMVEMQFVVPDIGTILGPEKYETVNKDIQEGLNNIMFGSGTEEKFSNTQTKVRVFVEKIRRARQTFLNNFLMPEVKRISKLMGFKSYPTAHFEDIDIENEIEFSRMVTRLAELGLLTPPETFTAMENGRLPTEDESLESQEKYKEAKDKGYYQPIVGGPKDKEKLAEMGFEAKMEQVKSQPGRPTGTKAPKKPAAVGRLYSTKEITNTFLCYNQLEDAVSNNIKKKFNLAELNESQKEIVNEVSESIMANESRDSWKDKKVIASYLKDPSNKNLDRIAKLEEIKFTHQCDNFIGCILLNSCKDA